MSISSRRINRTSRQGPSDNPTIQPGAVSVSVSGSSITVTGTITTQQPVTFDGLNISVARDTTGYPWVFSTAVSNGQVVNGVFTLNGAHTGIADGSYVAYMSYSLDGQTTWVTGGRTSFTINTASATIPAAPTNLAVTTAAPTSLGLSWTAPVGVVTGYNIYRNGTLLSISPTADTSFTDTDLSAQTSYTYEIKAVNSSGEGPAARISTATATADPGVVYAGPVTASFSGNTVNLSGALTTAQPTNLRVNISVARDETGYPWVKSVAAVGDGSVSGTLQLSEGTALALGNYVAYVSYSTDGGANWVIGTRTSFVVTSDAPVGGAVDDPVVAIYRKVWNSDPSISLVPMSATEIRLSFLQNDPPRLTGYTVDGQAQFLSILAQRRQAGQAIVASIGGAAGNVNTGNRSGFVQGIGQLKTMLESVPGGGLDGIDWDIEVGSSFPTADAVAISSQLKNIHGNNFQIVMAPNGTNKVAYRQAAGQMQAAGCLDWIGQQFYDANVSLSAAKTEIQNYINAGVPAHKVGVGMLVSDNPNKGWTLQQCQNYMIDIRNTWPSINKVYIWTEAGEIPIATQWINAMRPIVGL